jgi:hypothetical protein
MFFFVAADHPRFVSLSIHFDIVPLWMVLYSFGYKHWRCFSISVGDQWVCVQLHQLQATGMDGTSWSICYGSALLHPADCYALASTPTHCERHLQGLPAQMGYWRHCVALVG